MTKAANQERTGQQKLQFFGFAKGLVGVKPNYSGKGEKTQV